MKKILTLFLAVAFSASIFPHLNASVMIGEGREIEADIFANCGRRYTTDGIPQGYIIMWSGGGFLSGLQTADDCEIENGFEFFEFPKNVWQEKNLTRRGPNSFGFLGDGLWRWQVPARANQTIYLDAYIRLTEDYPYSDNKPKLTLKGPGVNTQTQPGETSYTSWEKLTLEATPTSDTILILEAQGRSTTESARFFIDDISIRH